MSPWFSLLLLFLFALLVVTVISLVIYRKNNAKPKRIRYAKQSYAKQKCKKSFWGRLFEVSDIDPIEWGSNSSGDFSSLSDISSFDVSDIGHD
ncbi:MAG: hypothetical protein COA78_29735 [Blastopirellula sp.]|nr:MAG: hypothetical protein COA78_29735 [Blastopirellula sp.]